MKATQHVPGFCSGFEPKTGQYTTTEELLSLPFVKRWKDDRDFFRFSLSDSYLMAEMKGGSEWWVVAMLESTKELELPAWKAPLRNDEKEWKGHKAYGYVVRYKRPCDPPSDVQLEGKTHIHLQDPSPNRYRLENGVYQQIPKYLNASGELNPEWQFAEFEDAVYFAKP